MCGIAGFVAREAHPRGEAALGAMMHALRHRGPDGEGRWLAPDRSGT
jgi:asparagine synthase (glutamine-hydrolysing)